MSMMFPYETVQPEWVSMWLNWPLRFYGEWLNAYREAAVERDEKPQVDVVAMQEFGIREDEKELVLVAEAPEFRSNELATTIKRNTLNIQGERHEKNDDGELHVSYRRKVTLPRSVNTNEATTSLRDGLVEVRIPKRAAAEEAAAPGANEESTAEQEETKPQAKAPRPRKTPKRKSRTAPRISAAAKRGRAKKPSTKSSPKKSKRR